MYVQKGYYVGIDVGTQSTRAALVTKNGEILGTASHPLKIWNPASDIYVQSSSDIWEACCQCLSVMETEFMDYIYNLGLETGFTQSCVVAAREDDHNIILWMDHRATEEAQMVSATSHPLLKYVGHTISLEMQPPKLLWLKKWLYPSATVDQTGLKEWDDFWSLIGLPELCQDNYSKIALVFSRNYRVCAGNHVIYPGQSCGDGLTAQAAKELSLSPGVSVAGSMIDAYAGTLGKIYKWRASALKYNCSNKRHLVISSLTSAAVHQVSDKEVVSPGVWGPYWSALLPDLWMMEAGQSAAGALVTTVLL
ncbi:FGGY, partial [Cordylochernes scorpioides]